MCTGLTSNDVKVSVHTDFYFTTELQITGNEEQLYKRNCYSVLTRFHPKSIRNKTNDFTVYYFEIREGDYVLRRYENFYVV